MKLAHNGIALDSTHRMARMLQIAPLKPQVLRTQLPAAAAAGGEGGKQSRKEPKEREEYRGFGLRALTAAVSSFDIEQLLVAGAAADGIDDHGATPLHIAAGAGRADVVRALLSAGADAGRPDSNGLTPLHRAAATGSLGAEVVALLLGAKVPADAAARDGAGRTAAELSCGTSELRARVLAPPPPPSPAADAAVGGVSGGDNGGWGAATFTAPERGDGDGDRCDVDIVDASMPRAEFERRYILPMRPALIRNATGTYCTHKDLFF